MRQNDQSEDLKSPGIWGFVLLCVLVVVVTTVYGAIGLTYFDEGNGPGTFGDMFGALNALFSGLAFAGVIYAIWLQRQELALQRQELKDTRKELSRAAAAQIEQVALMREELDVRLQEGEAERRQRQALIQPIFEVRSTNKADSDATTLDVSGHIYNRGETVSDIEAIAVEPAEITLNAGPTRMVQRDHHASFRIRTPRTNPTPEIELQYRDRHGDRWTRRYRFEAARKPALVPLNDAQAEQ